MHNKPTCRMHVFGPWEEVPLVFGGRGSKQKPDCCEAITLPTAPPCHPVFK